MRFVATAIVGAVMAAGGLLGAACGEPTAPPAAAPAELRSLAAAMALASQSAHAALVPWRCTQMPPAGPVVMPWPSGSQAQAGVRRVAVMAGVREVTTASLARVKAFLAAATQAPLDAVVLLGGNAPTKPALQVLLDAVASPGYLTVVVPGNSERVPEIRDVIAQHAQRAYVVDATVPTMLDAGTVRLFLVGGMPSAAQLQWPVDGCVYHVGDVAVLGAAARALPVSSGGISRVVAMVAAPVRGEHDLGATAIKIGDPALAAALSGADAVVFAGAERASSPGRKAMPKDGQAPAQIALGALDAAPGFAADKQPLDGKALLLTIAEDQLTWQVWSAALGNWEAERTP